MGTIRPSDDLCIAHNWNGPGPCRHCDHFKGIEDTPLTATERDCLLGGGTVRGETRAEYERRTGMSLSLTGMEAIQAVEKAMQHPTASANDRQVGGSHYAGAYQHWDFVHDLNLDYWQACASKYVTRWRKKNGLEDLAKAPHYMEKRKELKRSTNVASHGIVLEKTLKLAQANGLDAYDIEAIMAICIGMNDDAVKLIDKIAERAATDRRGSFRPAGC